MTLGIDNRTFRVGHPATLSVRERLAASVARIRASAKEIARAVNTSPRTVENWRAANNAMTAETLIELCRTYDEVWLEVKQLAGRAGTIGEAEAMLDQVTKLLAERRRG